MGSGLVSTNGRHPNTTVHTGLRVPMESPYRCVPIGIHTRAIGSNHHCPWADATRQLGLWSLVPAEKADCYRKAEVEVIAASQVVRKYTFSNAFVVDYREDYGDVEGVGTFHLIIKQKKDKTAQITVEGGYSV